MVVKKQAVQSCIKPLSHKGLTAFLLACSLPFGSQTAEKTVQPQRVRLFLFRGELGIDIHHELRVRVAHPDLNGLGRNARVVKARLEEILLNVFVYGEDQLEKYGVRIYRAPLNCPV